MADIIIDDITNTDSNGIFDKLMEAVNSNIEKQYLENRITGSDYANVYLSSMQAVLQQSVQYVLTEQLTEAQIDGIAADNLLKAKQLEIAEQELLIKEQELLIRAEELALKITESNRLRDTTEAELEKQWGYDVTRDANGDLVLGASTGAGKIDKDIDIVERGMLEQEATGAKQRIILDDDHALKAYENTVLQVDQHITNLAQQTLLATEEEAKQYEVDNILPEQLNKLQEEVDLLQTQDLRAIYEKDNILPANLAQIQKETDVAERSMVEQELTGSKQRSSLDKDIAIKDYENTVLQVDQHETNLAQQLLLSTEEEAKQYEVDFILPEQVTKLQEEIDLLQTQDLSAIAEVQLIEQKIVGKKQSSVVSE